MNNVDKHTALETRNQAVSGLCTVHTCFKVSFVRLLMMHAISNSLLYYIEFILSMLSSYRAVQLVGIMKLSHLNQRRRWKNR